MTGEIKSRDNPRVKEARRIAEQPAFRRQTGLFFAEGKRLCFDLAESMAPEAAFFTHAFLQANPQAETLAAESFLVSDSVSGKLSDTKSPQGLFCLFRMPRQSLSAEDIARGVLLCEAVQNPANAGAMVRSAAAFGFGAVVLGAGSADPYAPKALRASMGAAARVCLMTDADIVSAVALLQRAKSTVYALALREGAVPLPKVKPARPLALLVGNEAAGLSAAAAEAADERVYIPMQNGVESLNAAAAASVAMYAFSA